MEIRRIHSEKVPAPRGAYSQAIVMGDLLFSAGQLPVDPDTGDFVRGSAGKQAERILENLKVLLEDSGSSMEKVGKVTVYLRDVKYWDEVNEVYSRYFAKERPPARTVLSGIDIHFGLDVEMDLVAEAGSE